MRQVDRYHHEIQRTALYRHYDGDGNLLYVGITNSAIERVNQHVKGSSWSDDIRTITIEWFDTRADAIDAEDIAIFAENPAFNVAGQRPHSPYADEKALRGAKLALSVITSRAPEPVSKDEIIRGVDWRDKMNVSVSRGISNLLYDGEIKPARNRFGRAAFVAANDNNKQTLVA